jgi:hypothetical protein
MNYDIITHLATFFSPKEAFQRSLISKEWYSAMQYEKSIHIKEIMGQAKLLHMLNNLCPCLLAELGFNDQVIKNIFPNELLLFACRYPTVPLWFHYLYIL